MNKIGKNIIELLCQYIELYDIESFRLCSKYLSIIVGSVYFSKITINISKINCWNRSIFDKFMSKY
jgi:hypothetical protein